MRKRIYIGLVIVALALVVGVVMFGPDQRESEPQSSSAVEVRNEPAAAVVSSAQQAYPPGVAPATEEAALAELDGLHALRVAHFGPVVARALYGAEEAVSRQLVELMRLEKDESLTMEEKAVRAQQLRDSMQIDR